MDHRTAIILMAYGSPNSLDEVADYLREVRGGRPATEEDVERLRERYRQVGGQTPLLRITLAQAAALQRNLDLQAIPTKVYIGMKHWHPFIGETVERIAQDEASGIVGLALAPHYSKLSIGGYENRVRRGIAETRPVPFTMVKEWHTQPHLIVALSRKVNEGLGLMEKPSDATVLFTAHSLPKKFVESSDPYTDQLHETSSLVARQARVEHWDFAFQSAGQPEDAWLGPMIKGKIKELSNKGFREVLVCPVGFVSDHLEILFDLDIEAKEYGRSLGMRIDRTQSLNDDPEFIQALADALKPLLAAMVAVA